jgi:hypothetical protein
LPRAGLAGRLHLRLLLLAALLARLLRRHVLLYVA